MIKFPLRMCFRQKRFNYTDQSDFYAYRNNVLSLSYKERQRTEKEQIQKEQIQKEQIQKERTER
jgi:hypothetical protein